MSGSVPSPSSRPAYYVTADDALVYAHYFNLVAGMRGWSQWVMEENLPGWSLDDFMNLLKEHRVIVHRRPGGWCWRSPAVVGVLIEGDTVVRDRGALVHPAKASARRCIRVGSTSKYVRLLHGDGSKVVVHVRCSAVTDDERELHRLAREVFLASTVRPNLVLNVSSSLIDPFDAPMWEQEMADTYQADVARLLDRLREPDDRVRLFTLEVHDGGDEIVVERRDSATIPPVLRRHRRGISSRVVSLRADTLYEPRRADTVAALVHRLARPA